MKPRIMSITAKYVQSPDDDDPHRGVDQELIMAMTHCGAGPFLIIETERWAMDRPKELHRLVRDFAAQVEALFDLDQGA